VEGRGGLLARAYENGVVVCNDSGQPQPLPYNPAWVLVDGDSQCEHYPQWLAGQSITISSPDGLVFGYAATELAEAPSALSLLPGVPNPFNPATTVRFLAPRSGKARLDIFDASGRLVTNLLNAAVEAGEHSVLWQGRTAGGDEAASGLYLCRLVFDGEARTTRLLLIR
jgi:hypothetical protein